MRIWLFILLAAPAFAQDARHHFDQGVALFRDHNYDGALAEFQRSNELSPLPLVRYNIALAEKALGRFAEAIDDFTRYLDETTPVDPLRSSVHRELVELNGLVAPLTLQLSPADATLRLDGHAIALRTPILLAPGRHQLAATREGYQPMEIELSAEAREPLAATLELKPLAKVLPLPTAELTLSLEKHPRKKRIWERWYFWTPICVAAAGGIALGLAFGLGGIDPIVGTLDPGAKKLNK